MTVLRTMTWASMSEDDRARLCARGLADIFDPALRASIAELVEDVRVNGDDAVCRALAKFDGVNLRADQLAITPAAIADAKVSPDLEAALSHAITNLRTFNEKLVERASNWSTEIQPGLSAGERITPISSAGLFVPSGKASYPSVAYQLGVPAVVAGVPDIALLVPPQPGTNGEVDPAILVVCRMLGISRVYRANGPAGIAALGFGTQSITPVRKIVGPGSPAVTCAQVEMQRHGVATMMLLGPTESLVIADDSADPVRLAADLLIEAEHGTDSSVVLVSTSSSLINRVDAELERQLAALPAFAQRPRARRSVRTEARFSSLLSRKPPRSPIVTHPNTCRLPSATRPSTVSSTCSSTQARFSSANTRRSARETSSLVVPHHFPPVALPTCRRVSRPKRS